MNDAVNFDDTDFNPSGGSMIRYPYGPTPEGNKVLWRCELSDNELPDTVLLLTWHKVYKTTPCGVWLDGRFVNLKRYKKWASETQEEAIEQFKHLKTRQLVILNGQLLRARRGLELAKTELERPKNGTAAL